MRIGHGERDRRIALLQGRDFAAQLDLHRRHAAHAFTQQGFHGRLGEHQRWREGQRVRRRHGGHAFDQLAVHPVKLGVGERLHERLQRLRDAQLLEHPHDFMVQRNGAGLVVHLGQLVADEGADALQTQQACGHRAGGAKSDDGDVEHGNSFIGQTRRHAALLSGEHSGAGRCPIGPPDLSAKSSLWAARFGSCRRFVRPRPCTRSRCQRVR